MTTPQDLLPHQAQVRADLQDAVNGSLVRITGGEFRPIVIEAMTDVMIQVVARWLLTSAAPAVGDPYEVQQIAEWLEK